MSRIVHRKMGEKEKIISKIRETITSQPFDEELDIYKQGLIPDDKIGYDKNLGSYGYYILEWQTAQYVYISKGIEEMTGYYQRFLERGAEAFWELVHPDDLEALYKILSLFMEMAEEMSEKEFNAHSFNFDYRLKKKTGGYVNILQQVLYTSFDRNGNIAYDAGIGFDISRYRNDGNKSLSIVNPDNGKVKVYYPKEEKLPKVGEVRNKFAELDHKFSRPYHPLLRSVRQEVLQNIDNESFGVSQLCEALSISRAKLYKEMSSLADITPQQLIKVFRLHKSLELLANEKLQVAEVAYRTGFNSPSYYSKCFREEFDCTPTEYRRKLLK